MKEENWFFVKLTQAALDHYRSSPWCSGYSPLTDDAGISMLDFESYAELKAEFMNRESLVDFFDPAFPCYLSDRSAGSGYDLYTDGRTGSALEPCKVFFIVPATAMLNPEELASELQVDLDKVRAMRGSGFSMPGGLASVYEAQKWIIENPEFEGKVAG